MYRDFHSRLSEGTPYELAFKPYAVTGQGVKLPYEAAVAEHRAARDAVDFLRKAALVLEAASRGAARVVMVEQAPKVLAALRENHEMLDKPGRMEIIRADALQYLASTQAKFDLIFLDPPYKKGWIARLEPLLPGVLNEDAALYVEAEHEIKSLGEWCAVRHGRAGEVHFHLLRRPKT